MKIQHAVLIAVLIAVISLGLQIASNTKLQSDIKNINFKTSEHDAAIQHLTVGLSESVQMSDLKNKTAEQDQLIQSLSSELTVSRQIMEKNNVTIIQLQQNTENLNAELKSLSERLTSLENKIPPPSPPPIVNPVSNSIVNQSKINVPSQSPFPINQTISMTKPDLKILSIAMFPNPLKVGDTPKFTVTFQNISNKELLQNLVGCGADPSLHWDIYPSSDVQSLPTVNNGLTCPPITRTIKPNDISMASGFATGNGLYQITQADNLNVILKLYIEDESISGVQATIQFNVTATR
jgi:uncharacterized coiled-coil protein SlyX